MIRRRRSKSLEKVARSIKDSDEFVEHVFNIAWSYRSNYELDAGPRSRAVRQSLRTFRKHADALGAWLDSAHRESKPAPEHEALSKIGLAMSAASSAARQQSVEFRAWLRNAAASSVKADKMFQGSRTQNAPRLAAEAVRATFEHHRLKVSYQVTKERQSEAVRLLCAIAKDGGDSSMTPTAAKDWLVKSGSRI
jgi:hypothetical protein